MDYFEVIYHKDITKEQMDKIVQLKEEHWKYGVDSQREWIEKNIQGDDIHILGYLEKNEKLISYSNLVNLKVEKDGELIDCLGLGNVCVCKEFEHKGHAKELILFSNEYIRGCEVDGITLCKTDKASMYSKYNWIKSDINCVTVGEKDFSETVMFLDKCFSGKIKVLNINKNF